MRCSANLLIYLLASKSFKPTLFRWLAFWRQSDERIGQEGDIIWDFVIFIIYHPVAGKTCWRIHVGRRKKNLIADYFIRNNLFQFVKLLNTLNLGLYFIIVGGGRGMGCRHGIVQLIFMNKFHFREAAKYIMRGGLLQSCGLRPKYADPQLFLIKRVWTPLH